MKRILQSRRPKHSAVLSLAILAGALLAGAQEKPATQPWMNPALSPDQRADLVIAQMTLEEKIAMLHGQGMPMGQVDPNSNGGAGYVVGVPRLGIPMIQMADSAYGVTRGAASGRYSTALPSDLGAASAWDAETAYEYGALIGRELRAQGYNMSLGGGVNLTREPRNGRTFEYQGEDPLLAGTLAGQLMRGVQSQHVIGDIKHYALNDQESGRFGANALIDQRSMRETDLLAFEIALQISDAGAVMCSYNRVNGDYACENKYLLNDVLKKDFGFKGFVVSDWGATHSAAKAALAGLDQEQPDQFYYGDALKKAVEHGEVPLGNIDEHVHRILRAEFANGLIDDPVKMGVVDVDQGMELAEHIASHSIVLLKNEHHLLPLDPASKQVIAVIGGHADAGVLCGGGSAQVDPPGGSPVPPPPAGKNLFDAFIRPAWLPGAPLKEIAQKFPQATVRFDSGENPESAATLAKTADVVVVFGYQWEAEFKDLSTLSLAKEQNDLIAQVTAANPHTVVVLETGGPVTMPWAAQVGAILEAWYPGIRGARALASILAGTVNPSGKLPVTFPLQDADLPHPQIAQPSAEYYQALYSGGLGQFMEVMAKGLPSFDVPYDEKLEVGYKWYDAHHAPVLFPFGYGLSYTTYEYSALQVQQNAAITVSFTVHNNGQRNGEEIAQVYASLPSGSGEPPKRLVGWSKVHLAAGESKQVSVPVNRKLLSIFDEKSGNWKLPAGEYVLRVGGSSQDLPLTQAVTLQ
jgi:beta-glucosidase